MTTATSASVWQDIVNTLLRQSGLRLASLTTPSGHWLVYAYHPDDPYQRALALGGGRDEETAYQLLARAIIRVNGSVTLAQPAWLTTSEAAQALNTTPGRVRQRISADMLRPLSRGPRQHARLDPADILTLAQRRHHYGAPTALERPPRGDGHLDSQLAYLASLTGNQPGCWPHPTGARSVARQQLVAAARLLGCHLRFQASGLPGCLTFTVETSPFGKVESSEN